MTEEEQTVQHDKDNGKFYVPFPDKQAVLRYRVDEDEEVISFQSIFVPPSLREDGLGEKIVRQAYSYVEETSLTPDPPTAEDLLDNGNNHI